ncbi:hypothetical protein AYI69_g6336 [Smittium culicis]|uniref:Uncharacterized protein n=1 Tax=Smittium culicis TaxID=133412 RepID=A0A1R1Y028_9FUNG|nr:hypothetical protein AYI69_g6336 [Smittium culicis]
MGQSLCISPAIDRNTDLSRLAAFVPEPSRSVPRLGRSLFFINPVRCAHPLDWQRNLLFTLPHIFYYCYRTNKFRGIKNSHNKHYEIKRNSPTE